MRCAKHLARVLRSEPLSVPQGLVVTLVSIFLYRGAQPRPSEHFHPGNVVHNPDSAYRCSYISNPGTFFAIYTDRYSLQRDEPLWFHIDAWGLDANSPAITSFHKTGGGGPGVQNQNGDADATTLRSLFSALRSFPADWERKVLLALDG